MNRIDWKARRRGIGRRVARVAVVAAVAWIPAAAYGQEDSVVVRAGPHYQAGALHRALFGSGYRDLWVEPIRVPLLRPDTAQGGLEVLQIGGGAQTVSLRFEGAGGQEFVFRSVDKVQSGGLHPDLRNTLIASIIQDQVSAKHPAGALVVAPLLEAAGVMHVTPTLAVMADDPSLGEHRSTFAGMLGLLEVRPQEGAGVGQFAGYERVIGTERLLERLEEGPEDRPQAEAYLRARLMDFLIGDWDRHPDQWRWAQVDRDGRRFWEPIPRDRDNAFSKVGGLAAVVGGAIRPTIVTFGPEYTSLYSLLHNAQPLDRQILSELEREVWVEVAADLQSRLTDEVIADAVASLPEAYEALNAAELERSLRARRDALDSVALDVFGMLAESIDVYATDLNDRATVEREADGQVAVRLADEDGATYFERRLNPGDTREVRVYLRGGSDEGVVQGTQAGPINVRLLGGGGDDRLQDRTSGENVFLYDDRGSNDFVAADETVVDERSFEEPETDTFAENNAPPARDWGSTSSMFSPEARWLSEVGPVIGGGPTWTRFGFRRFPYATQRSVTLLYGPLETRFGIEAEMNRVLTGGHAETRLSGRATQLEVTRFYGFGNETPEPGESSHHRVWSNDLVANLEYVRHLGSAVSVAAGAVVAHIDPEPADEFPARLRGTPGTGTFGTAGLTLGGTLDTRDSDDYPLRGLHFAAGVRGFPGVWGETPEEFGTGYILGRFYAPVPFPLETTLALRAGGEGVIGDAPLQHAAFLGGGSSLRGYRTQRFAGDASAFGSAELRTRLAHVNLWVVQGEIGALGHFDAGRVWWEDEDSDVWHAGYGGGLWFAPLDRQIIGHVVYSYGERHTLSAGLGMPF